MRSVHLINSVSNAFWLCLRRIVESAKETEDGTTAHEKVGLALAGAMGVFWSTLGFV